MTGTVATNKSNMGILPLLYADHRRVESLFQRYDQIPVEERQELFCELVPVLVGHEVAEEEILYPAIRSVAPGAGRAVDERIHEQSEAEELLKEMEGMDPAGEEFAAAFSKLRGAVLEHAESEEQTVFPLLSEHDTTLDLLTMGRRYEKAKAAAPTHPHPHAPDTPPGNLLLGPVAAMMDRVRDAL